VTVNIILGLLLIVLGLFFLNGKLLFLIAGYKDGRLNGFEVSEKKLSKIIGFIVMLTGLIVGIQPLLF
jgi:hypothetical protein